MLRFAASCLTVVFFLTAFFSVGFPSVASAKTSAEQDVSLSIYPLMTPAKLEHLLETKGAGKVVIVNFFASWCPPCLKELPRLVQLRGKLPEERLLIIGISTDEDVNELNKIVAGLNVNFPVYLGNMELFEFYKVSGIPRLLIFNRAGKVAEDITGLPTEDDFNKKLENVLGQDH